MCYYNEYRKAKCLMSLFYVGCLVVYEKRGNTVLRLHT